MHAREPGEVKAQQRQEEEEQDSDEKFRRAYLEQLRWSAAASKEKEEAKGGRKERMRQGHLSPGQSGEGEAPGRKPGDGDEEEERGGGGEEGAGSC